MATDRALKGKSCVVFVGVEKELPGGAPKTTADGIAAQNIMSLTVENPEAAFVVRWASIRFSF